MRKFYLVILIGFIWMPLKSYSQLKCSKNGTQLFYINGVLVKEQKENKLSVDNIIRLQNDLKSSLDEKGLVSPVENIHNESFGLYDVFEELEN